MSEINPNNSKNPVTFIKILQQDVKDIANSVSLQEFVEHMKDFDLDPKIVEWMHELMQNKINACQKHISRIFQDENVIDIYKQYNELLVNGIYVDGDAWRPPGDVKKHLQSLDAHIYIQENLEMESKILEITKENELLMEEISKHRKKFRDNEILQLDIIKNCEETIKKLNNFNTTAEEVIHNVQTVMHKTLQ